MDGGGRRLFSGGGAPPYHYQRRRTEVHRLVVHGTHEEFIGEQRAMADLEAAQLENGGGSIEVVHIE